MALNGDRSSTIENCTFRVIGPTWIGNTMLPRDVVEAPLNPDNISPGFSRFEGEVPICLITDTCKRLAELLGSTEIHLTLKSLIPNFRIRTSRCSYNIWLGFTGEKVTTPSIGRAFPLVNLGRTKLTCSRTEAAQNNLCLFLLELYSSSRGSSWI